jgi:molybdate transport system substrate-binding protein
MGGSAMQLVFALAAIVGLLMGAEASAAEIKVLASPASREAFFELISAFESATGHKVVVTWSGTKDIKKQIAAGEVYDIVVVARPELDEMVKGGRIVPTSVTDVVKSRVGAAVRAGHPKPDIGSADALKKTLLSVGSIGYSSGPSGDHMAELFKRMGIADQIKGKLKQTPPGVRIATVIVSGEVELGFQQVSELTHEPGIDYIGPLPDEVQKITVFSGGIHTKASDPQAASAFLKHLTSPAAAPVIRKHGLEPA